MGNICEHAFEQLDPREPDYSMTEYDLYAKTGLTLRKNHLQDRYELVSIAEKRVHFSGTLESMIRIANGLEGRENTKISCGGVSCHKTAL